MSSEILTPAEMAAADRIAIERGPFDGFELMLNAGRAVARLVLNRIDGARQIHILCGPGNNGGDGYIAASELQRAGLDIRVYALAPPRGSSDAASAAEQWEGGVAALSDYQPFGGDIVIDALFGAGLERPLEGQALEAVARTRAAGARVFAIDLPSGVSGESGRVLGDAFDAEATISFFRKKPGHLLYPGRERCGDLVIADIGISPDVLQHISVRCNENLPGLWRDRLPLLPVDVHKYSRGAVGIFSGGPYSSGAARLAALAAQRAGSGAVTVLSPENALLVNACQLTSIMLARTDTAADLVELLRADRFRAFVLGPGFGAGDRLREFAMTLLSASPLRNSPALVLDADAITTFAATPSLLFDRAVSDGALVLTPHEGEFGRLFPEIAASDNISRLEKARRAARLAGATIVLKGPDTVIAGRDGRAAINTNGTIWLATAGSGDVLAGIIAALLSQGMPEFEAAAAAVWIHAEAGGLAGTNAIAEDLPQKLPAIFSELDQGRNGR